MTLLAKRLSATARLPSRAEEGSVGYDLYLDLGDPEASVTIPPGGRFLAHSNVAMVPPPGCYIQVAGRSGLAAKHGIDVLAGVIDPSYRGSIAAVLLNTQNEDHVPVFGGLSNCVTLKHGDRVAQLVVLRCELPSVEEFAGDLPTSTRGVTGFGSTGT